MSGRILVIRGGAIGDFILTLPAIKLIREAFPDAHLEIIGYRHIVALAEGRFYANATRSIEYGPLAGFFARRGNLSAEMTEYFASFQQVISYLFDPDRIFETNLRRAGVKNYLPAFTRIDDSQHAAQQLALPLQRLALFLEDPAATIHLSSKDHAAADHLLRNTTGPIIAIHPGSGSPRKNWPPASWEALGQGFLAEGRANHLLLLGGEADLPQLQALQKAWGDRALLAQDLPLPHLAAAIARCALFFGHDSGISHLAAAAGTRCVLLFGPTDPAIWAPANPDVQIIRAPSGDLATVDVETVARTIRR
jgi:heptosyltransferase-2